MSKKRYRTADAILKDIDDCHKQSRQLLIDADEAERSARELYRLAQEQESAAGAGIGEETIESVANLRIEGDRKLVEAGRMRRRSVRLVEDRARKLGYKLSEFKTGALISLDGRLGIGDKSVQGL